MLSREQQLTEILERTGGTGLYRNKLKKRRKQVLNLTSEGKKVAKDIDFRDSGRKKLIALLED